mgnify:CR=1 FL=1
MLGLGFSADFAFAGAPCEFLLNSAEGGRVDNGRVTVFYIVFRAFTVVDSDLFADAVGDVGLIDDSVFKERAEAIEKAPSLFQPKKQVGYNQIF